MPREAYLVHDSHQILIFLLAFRLLNAVTVTTFFQPDEYYQALEPAWEFTSGYSGAWITWEWKQHLRSAFHPAIFSTVYQATDILSPLFGSDTLSDSFLIFAPKTIQAVIAAYGDYYSWRLASKVYGDSQLARTTLYLTVLNPWQWFCSTRTFSNGLESTLTAAALYHWPLTWQETKRTIKGSNESSPTLSVRNLRLSLLLAAIATVLRPTNLLLWVTLAIYFLVPNWASASDKDSEGRAVKTASTSGFTYRLQLLMKEAFICGSLVLAASAFIDRAFYGVWTFPILNFFYFNVVQSLAVFYGNNDWHYYISQGYPLMLTTALPFTIVGLYRSFRSSSTLQRQTPNTQRSLKQLATICVVLPSALSVLSHKEVRFIYPVLAPLHVIATAPVLDFFKPTMLLSTQKTNSKPGLKFTRTLILLTLLSLNLLIAGYTSLIHNSGLIAFPEYIRNEFQTHYNPHSAGKAHSLHAPSTRNHNLTLAILMPCHSVPWRSHLLNPPSKTRPGIQAWALTCEPPLHLTNTTAKQTYLDEADIFYANPSWWIKENMSRRPPWVFSGRKDHDRHHEPGVYTDPSAGSRNKKLWSRRDSLSSSNEPRGLDITDLLPGLRTAPGRPPDTETGEEVVRRPWPHYLAFFEQLEPVMKQVLRGSGYVECWRVFNSHWHDDWRRQGDVVVWCLFPERANGGRGLRGAVGNGAMEEGDGETEQPVVRVVPDRPGKQQVIRPQGRRD